MSLITETGLQALFSALPRNSAVRLLTTRRLREVFWRGLPVFTAGSLLLLGGGWWLLGLAGMRYGAADAAPEIAHYGLGLALGQAVALAYATARVAPSAYLDVRHRRTSREWDALLAMHIDAPAVVCTPWLITGAVTALGFWALYYVLYLAVEQFYPVFSSWMGVSFVPIGSGAFASLPSLLVTLPCAAAGGLAAAWVTLALATRERISTAGRNAALGLRAFLIALISGSMTQGALYALLH